MRNHMDLNEVEERQRFPREQLCSQTYHLNTQKRFFYEIDISK